MRQHSSTGEIFFHVQIPHFSKGFGRRSEKPGQQINHIRLTQIVYQVFDQHLVYAGIFFAQVRERI